MLDLVSHYMRDRRRVETMLLILKRFKNIYNNENMVEIMLEIINDYDISLKIGYFVFDNAFSNDTCVEVVLRELGCIDFIKESRRLRCFGYICQAA
jgi:hypothetical protein